MQALAHGRSAGTISETKFVDAVLQIEADEVSHHGFSLSASNTIDNWTVFVLRIEGSADACAQFEFLPETGEFRRVGSGPEEAQG